MLSDLFSAILLPEHNHSRLNALVNEALSEGGRHDDNAGKTLLREAIDAVVVLLVVHPELEPIKEVSFCLDSCVELHLDGWV